MQTDPAATYTGSVQPSAATGGTFTASNYIIGYNNGNVTVTALNGCAPGTPLGKNNLHSGNGTRQGTGTPLTVTSLDIMRL